MIQATRLAFAVALAAVGGALSAQQRLPNPPESALPMPPYADFADLVIAAPVIVDANIRDTTRLKGPDAAGVPAGMARLYVQADVVALIRGDTPLPPRIAYVLDVPVDANGRFAKLRKMRVLLFARPVPQDPALLQLVRPDAQRSWTLGGQALARHIIQEVLAPDAPPQVTGIGNAFHVTGDLPGAGETQIFLTTADGRPVSLTVDRRPGESPSWSVALSEIVDAAAHPPARNTLLWYRLACALPATLPDASLAGVSADDAKIAREDYGFVLQSLGTCDRGGAL